MKPTGATKEATVSEQAIEIIKDCSNWSDIRYRILPRVEALISERERLREIARLTDALIVKLYDKHLVPYLMEHEVNTLRNRIHAALNNTTPSTSAGGG